MKKILYLLLSVIIIFTFTSCNKNSSVEKSDTLREQLISVINSEKVFKAENGTELYLKDFVYGSNETTDYYAVPYEYAFVDCDDDGVDELVADISLNQTHYMVFHIVDKDVYGFLFGNRSLQSIKDDGTFIQTGGADINYFCKMEFNKDSYEIINTAVKDESIGKFEIDGKQCTIDVIDEYIEKWYSKATVEWLKVS